MNEAREYNGKRFITGRMFLMHKQRYDNLFPITGPACKDSTLRWEEVMSCESCRFNLKRASLNEAGRGWHLDFPAPAGPELEKALNLVESGVAVQASCFLIVQQPSSFGRWSPSL